MRKLVGGSKSVRGRKNRKVIKRQVARKPPSEAQTMPRRSLFTGGSGGSLSTVLLLAAAEVPTVDFAGGAVAAFAGGAFSVVTTFCAGGFASFALSSPSTTVVFESLPS